MKHGVCCVYLCNCERGGYGHVDGAWHCGLAATEMVAERTCPLRRLLSRVRPAFPQQPPRTPPRTAEPCTQPLVPGLPTPAPHLARPAGMPAFIAAVVFLP